MCFETFSVFGERNVLEIKRNIYLSMASLYGEDPPLEGWMPGIKDLLKWVKRYAACSVENWTT